MCTSGEDMKISQNLHEAQDPGSIELVNNYISCAPSYMSVFAHVLILECVQKMIVFIGDVLAV